MPNIIVHFLRTIQYILEEQYVEDVIGFSAEDLVFKKDHTFRNRKKFNEHCTVICPGETYYTTDRYDSAQEAQSMLAIPNTPNHRIEFTITNNPTVERSGTTVQPYAGQPRGGTEFMTNDPVQVSVRSIQPLT